MAVTISARVPEETAEHLRSLAREEERTLSELVNRAVDEYVRCARFPGIVFVTGGSGRRRATLQGGGSVWGIVLNARGLDMDPERTAEWLQIPVAQVRLALAYYTAYPDEIDAHLRYIEEFDEDPKRFCPSIRVIKVSDTEDEASS
jgi:hypothetical protein